MVTVHPASKLYWDGFGVAAFQKISIALTGDPHKLETFRM